MNEAPGNSPGVPLREPDGAQLIAAASMPMPFGRFAGTRLIDLPEPYIVWFHREGFPAGTLGKRLALIHEIKLNGLEKLVRPLLDRAVRAP